MPELRTPKRLNANNPNKPKSVAQETKSAKRFGGDLVRGSGAGRVKGDVRKERVFRLEAKTTKNESFSVTRTLIEKLEDSVPAGMKEVPFMEIQIGDQSGQPKRVFIFPDWVMDTLIEALTGRAG